MSDLKQLSKLWDGFISQWAKLNILPIKKEYKDFVEEEEKMALEFCGCKKNAKVIDVGCGFGQLLEKIADKEEKCYGMDISIEALKMARKKLPDSVMLIQHDATEKWPFKDEFFDCVICTGNTLGNVIEPQTIIKETSRCLKNGGVAMFGIFNSEYLNENTAKEVYEKYETPIKFKEFDAGGKTVLMDGGLRSHWFTKEELERLFSESKLKPKIEERGIGFIVTAEKV